MAKPTLPIKGRGTAANPPNRFESIERIPEYSDESDPSSLPTTQFLPDASRSVIAHNDSPDVGFRASLNPYRGCEHGCAYCYARPTHEYLGYSSGLDFETKILVKESAPDLLRRELSSPKWRPQVLALSGVTDPYQPIERKTLLTRKLLEVLLEFRNPVIIITKNSAVQRDIDLLSQMARFQAAAVFLSLPTLDRDLSGVLEPRAARPEKRLETISALAEAGVPVGVMVAPVIPGLTDAEIPGVVEAAARAGAKFAGAVPLRLPHAVAPLFESWLATHRPDRKEKVLNRIRSMRGGKLNDPRFGVRMEGEGIFADQIHALFETACKRSGIQRGGPSLSTEYFRRPGGSQLSLFAGA